MIKKITIILIFLLADKKLENKKKSRLKWVFENPTNCAATFGGLGFLFGATIEGGGLIPSLIWGGVMGVLIYFTVRFLRGN